MVIFPLAPDQTIAQMWSSGARGSANLGPDSSGTRFRRQLEHCSIPSQKVVHTWLKWWLVIDRWYCWRFHVSWSCFMQCCYLFVYLIFSDTFIYGA